MQELPTNGACIVPKMRRSLFWKRQRQMDSAFTQNFDDPSGWSARHIVQMISSGDIATAEVLQACLGRIARLESTTQAWVHIDADGAAAAARAVAPGPLRGVPVAVKDVIDVVGMPTGMGSPIYRDYRPLADAACIAALRAAGAIILGKTVTAEFAGITPGPTIHPAAPAHTPGGSSSGSAAAVAAGMVPVALGTQTGGSVIRPAAFCGIVGFKPSFGLINRAGLKFAAESFDTIGLMARDVDDVALVWSVLGGGSPALVPLAQPPRLAIFRTHRWDRAEPETVAQFESVAGRLQASGARIEELTVPDGFDALSEARAVINNYERARALAWEWQQHRDLISPRLQRVISDGFSRSFESYCEAQRLAERWRCWLDDTLTRFDAIMTPATNGPAPEGLESTGDPAFQEIWTVLHTPTITLPLARAANGLPLGVQFVGARRADDHLLEVASWVGDAARLPPSGPTKD